MSLPIDRGGRSLNFSFRGKAGIKHSVDGRDRRLARVVRQCQELPGLDGTLAQSLTKRVDRHLETSGTALRGKESLVLSVLHRRLASDARAAARASDGGPDAGPGRSGAVAA